jgi:hypothetical protein
MTRLLPTCLVVGATLALASCSAIDIVYNNAPSFVGGEIEDALDLDDEQRAQLDARLQRSFDWHRQQELARYRVMLSDAALAIEDGISAEEYLAIYNDVHAAWERSLLRLIDDLHGLTAILTPAQIDSYDQYFRERSEKYQDYLEMSPQQREIFNTTQAIEQLEDWTGKLEDLQLEKITARLRQLPQRRMAWIYFREARHQALIAALRKAPGKGLSVKQLQYILLDNASEYARVYEPQRIAYYQAYAQMIEEVSGWLNKAQIAHAVERMREFEEIVVELQQNG